MSAIQDIKTVETYNAKAQRLAQQEPSSPTGEPRRQSSSTAKIPTNEGGVEKKISSKEDEILSG